METEGRESIMICNIFNYYTIQLYSVYKNKDVFMF